MVEQVNNQNALVALHSGVLQNLAMVQSADNAIEAKAVGITALSIAFTVFLIQADPWYFLSVVSIVLLLGSLTTAMWCLRINDYTSAAVKVSDHPEYLEMENHALLLQLLSDAESSFDCAAKIVSKKAKFFTWSYGLLLVGVLVGLVSLKYKLVGI